MPNYWYLSFPCSKENASSYKHQWLQELIIEGNQYGYISSFDDDLVQHHYTLNMQGELVVFDGSIDEFFTGNSVYIS